jgi:enoyl-CoA hydratase
MSYETILVDKRGSVALVTVNRPDKLNALNDRTMEELDAAFAALASDPVVRGVILTGSGEKAFVAGADIGELSTQTPVDGKERSIRGQRVLDRIENLGKPVIAAVNGFALGGGCELAMACTLRIAAETAKFGQPEINLGLIPGFAGTQRLARLVGRTKAMEMVLTGSPIGAHDALAIGLVNRVVPPGELMPSARALASDLAAKAPIAMRYAMDAIGHGLDMPFADACRLEAALFGASSATEDMKEGTRAFLEKRKAVFKGR